MLEKEIVFEYNKMVVDHTSDLWKISSALVVIEFLMIAYVLKVKNVSSRRSHIRWVLMISVMLNSLSFVFGYIGDAATINNMEAYAREKGWEPSKVAEVFNLLQMSSLTLGITVFLLAFFWYSDVLAEIITKVGVKTGND